MSFPEDKIDLLYCFLDIEDLLDLKLRLSMYEFFIRCWQNDCCLKETTCLNEKQYITTEMYNLEMFVTSETMETIKLC